MNADSEDPKTNGQSIPELEACGFVRVPQDPGSTSPLFLTCDQCGKSDHFWVQDETVCCRCGARYSHASRPDGRQIPTAELTFVPWKEGPMNLADTEVDPIRVTVAIVVVLAVLTGIAGAIWWALSG